MSGGAAVFNSRYSRAVLSKSDWEDHREFIQKHYIENDKTLEDLKVLLKENLGVEVTKHQLEYRCRRWKFRKNYSQAYPRQSQNQSVLKFGPVEAKKGRAKPKASCESPTSPDRQAVRVPQEDGIRPSSPYASHVFSHSRPFVPGLHGPSLPRLADDIGYPMYLGPRSCIGSEDVYSTQDQNGNKLLRNIPEIDALSLASYDSSLYRVPSPELDQVDYSERSSSPLHRTFETSLESRHEQMDPKYDLWFQKYVQGHLGSNPNSNVRNSVAPYLDSSYNTWPLSAPHPFYDSTTGMDNWEEPGLHSNGCTESLQPQQQNNFAVQRSYLAEYGPGGLIGYGCEYPHLGDGKTNNQ
ncbi:hypothetical protein TWF718_004630 [Orbilia javanica]|uniref:Clr5 domain-containing protein n=1 Tax=Orbilia javanica TaxID=47235 RepID=A0AAN8N8N0_9PEZI